MKSQVKAITKIKRLLVLIPIIVLGGIFLLQRLKSGESSELQKPLFVKDEISNAVNNTNITGDKSSESQPIVTLEKTSPEVSFSTNSQKRLASEVSELELPSPLGDTEIDMVIAKVQAIQVYKEQDKIMATWPVYLDVREKLYKELLAELDLDALSIDELVDMALNLRNKFWQTGGNLSTVSYKDGYKARILLELAHNKNPENIAVTDELVETIQSIETAWKYKGNSNKKLANPTYLTTLPELRSVQFSQIKKEVEQSRTLTWEDFVCAYELALLWGRADESKSAQEVVSWLIPEAERTGYDVYIEQLKRLEQKLKENSVLEFNIYVSHTSIFDEIKYGRRFPSFKGPDPQERRVRPVHESLNNPTWYHDPIWKK